MIKLTKTFDTDTDATKATGFNYYEYPAGMSDAMSLQSVLTRKGAKAIKVRLRKTDPEAQFGNKRTELSHNNINTPDTTLRWWRWSNYFPSPYGTDAAEEVIAQWHDKSALCSASPSLGIEIKDDRFRAAVRSSTQDYCSFPSSRVLNYYDLGPVTKDTWLDWVINYDPKTDSSGKVKIWLNGSVVLDITGACAYIGSAFPYWKLGIYKWSWMPSWGGTASTQTIREFYVDEIMIGDVDAVYGDFLIDSIVIPDPEPTEPPPPTSSDLISFIEQPYQESLYAAYRPIILTISAQSTNSTAKPPVVYCDIYFAGIYYKTLSKTQYNKLNLNDSEWQFDIQDAAQEYLKKFLGSNGGTELLEAAPILTKAMCKFRTSGYDANGFIKAEGTAPVQGTGNSAPIPGSGVESFQFYIVNATLQHEDYQILGLHLSAFKKGVWDNFCFPLTHRPDGYKVGIGDSDYFPTLISSNECINSIGIKYKFIGQNLVRENSVSVSQPCTAIVSGITAVQAGGTRDVAISWNEALNATGYLYRLDGGPWIGVSATSLSLSALTLGGHTIEIAATCQCSDGVATNFDFAIEDPISFICNSVVSAVTATQSGEGALSVNWTIIGTPISYRYRIDGGPWIVAPSKPLSIAGLTPESQISNGTHTIDILPVCSNGVAGTPGSVTKVVLAIPSITKVNETNTGPGGIRTQIFKIGGNVTTGNRFVLTVYSHDVTVIAVAGDTPSTIATKMRDAINATTPVQWNSSSSAPVSGTSGYPPTATVSIDQVTVTLNFANSFSFQAYTS